jgi:hypothetical protein
MCFSIKLPYAIRNGELIHISKVTSGKQNDCLCPECNQPLIAKKGNKVTHHFAHEREAICNLESALHKVAKNLLHLRIRTALDNGLSLRIHYYCETCGDEHDLALLGQARDVKLETSLGVARPDILLLNKAEKPIIAIEVIFRHSPEVRVKAFYESQKITLVEIHIQSESTFLELQNFQVLHADYVSWCPTPKCPHCQSRLRKKYLHIVEAPCFKCKNLIKISFLEIAGECYSPESFNTNEHRLATARGCTLKRRYSKTSHERYLANTCTNCDAFIGNYFLDDYFQDFADGESAEQTGWFCLNCKRSFD